MGNSYTRQSAADIVDGNIVEATPINNEFNALQGAFDGTLGHTHDGTTGEGPKINLTNSVTGVLPVANGGTDAINKLNATTAPTANDDSGDGYGVGSMWIDVTNDIFYVCLDATVGAAIWRRSQSYNAALASIAGLTTSADKMIYTTASDTYTTATLTSYGRSLIDDVDATSALTTLGVSTYAKTLLDDVDASTALSTLGVSTYIKTLLDDADASTARGTLGLGTMATQNSNAVSVTGGTITGITDITVADGGTGASTAPNARTNLDVYSKGETDTAISTAIGSIVSIPSGAVMAFAMNTAPGGWLECSGAAVSRSTYSALFTAIGTTFGAGDGSTTFNLPQLRGEFIRGWDNGRGVDSGRAFGSAQSSANLAHSHAGSTADSGGAHTHTASTGAAGSHAHSGTTDVQGTHTHDLAASGADGSNDIVRQGNLGGATIEGGAAAAGAHAHNLSINAVGDHTHTVTVNSGGAHTHTLTISSDGGSESRPRNIAMLYCIKT